MPAEGQGGRTGPSGGKAAPFVDVIYAGAHILLLREEAHAVEESVFRDLRAEAASAAIIAERLVHRIIAEGEAAACPSRRWWSRTCSSRRQACSRGPYRPRRLPVLWMVHRDCCCPLFRKIFPIPA